MNNRYSTFYQTEEEYIKQLIFKAGGNLNLAAKISGLGRTTIYNKLKKYGINRKWYLSKSETSRCHPQQTNSTQTLPTGAAKVSDTKTTKPK